MVLSPVQILTIWAENENCSSWNLFLDHLLPAGIFPSFLEHFLSRLLSACITTTTTSRNHQEKRSCFGSNCSNFKLRFCLLRLSGMKLLMIVVQLLYQRKQCLGCLRDWRMLCFLESVIAFSHIKLPSLALGMKRWRLLWLQRVFKTLWSSPTHLSQTASSCGLM